MQRLYLAVGTARNRDAAPIVFKPQTTAEPVAGGWELGITISLPTDVDILRITEVYHEAQEHELRVAFDEFQGNGAQVLHLKSLLPDYLVLGGKHDEGFDIDAPTAAPLGVAVGCLRRAGD